MNRQKLESICRRAGMGPGVKEQVRDGIIYVADGFFPKPDIQLRRFGAKPGEFPFGAWCAMWWFADNEDKVVCGQPLLFDAMHDKEKGWPPGTKKRARINKAIAEAKGFLATRERVRANG